MANNDQEIAPIPEAVGKTNGKASKYHLIASILNSFALLGGLGFILYSKFLFKKPLITEDRERERLRDLYSNPTVVLPAFIKFDPLTVNIKTLPNQHLADDKTTPQQMSGILHFVTLGFALKIRDESQHDFIKTLSPLILDRLIFILGKKSFHELTTIQGRYVFRSQFLDQINQLITPLRTQSTKEELISDIYFTQFIVQ